jgi:acyl carrier protein
MNCPASATGLDTISREEAPTMIDEIRQFVLDSLTDMNYSIDGIDDDTVLGPAGADLESLALAELAVRVEDKFGVKFGDDDGERLAGMTVGEFCNDVRLRIQPASAH